MHKLVDLLRKKPPKRILIITLRYLGDTLLCTPLISSIRGAYPSAQIDVLLYDQNRVMLEGNSDIDNFIVVSSKFNFKEAFSVFLSIFRKYDLAVSTQTSDKAVAYAFVAAASRIGFVPNKNEKGWWKRFLLAASIEAGEEKTHAVLELLKLSSLLQIPPKYELTPPQLNESEQTRKKLGLTDCRYAVIHVMPQWRYKQWTNEGWKRVGAFLNANSVRLVISGGKSKSELAFINELLPFFPENTLNLAGKVTLQELTDVLHGALLYIGPDTGTTHLASASKIPTVALFGPSDPVKWAPWPANYQLDRPPFSTKGCQRVSNVFLVQGDGECVPCYNEGCNKHRDSTSACLENLQAEKVINVLREIIQKK